MMGKIFYLILSGITIISIYNNAAAYDDKITHPDITINSIRNSKLDAYLKNNLGFKDGIQTKIPSTSKNDVLFLLRKGSELEDLEPCRRANHMHNPLLPWSESYMSDEPLWAKLGCLLWTRYSAITWATGQETKGGSIIARKNQAMGWDNARTYFYKTLTSGYKTDRETYFAETLQALGQVMHLLQDMAVPAHTRNDFSSHLTHNGLLLTGFYQPFESYVKSKPNLVSTAIPASPYFTTPYLTDFWDTDQYPQSVGLSEFSNANYFSDSTIPTNNPTKDHKFNTPSIDSNNYQICEDYEPGSTTRKIKYVSRKAKADCDHFAAVSALNPLSYMNDINYLNANISKLKLWLDDNVHNTYANDLIPRAVGYSAGLLDYFFRGNIGIERDQNAPDELVVMNLSAEQMNGMFGLYYDDATDYRRSVGSWGLDIPAYSPKYAPLSYCTLKDLKPEPKQKGIYILTFQGTMGNEAGAVVANANINLLASSCGTALTITGPDTIAQDTSTQLEVSGCTGCADDVTWTASGTGASIDKTGLLTVDKTACGGTLTITAKCPDCKTEISKTITIPDLITISGPDAGKCYTTTGAEPYQWSITKGSIDEKGCVTTTGECGTATLTVTDTNGCTGTKEVNLSAENCSALTIVNENGASATDTILRNGVLDFKTTGNCCEDIQWSVSAAAGSSLGGATISQAGVLTAGATSCGSLLVTATCVECGTSATQYVRVTNAGTWAIVSSCGTGLGAICERIEGNSRVIVRECYTEITNPCELSACWWDRGCNDVPSPAPLTHCTDPYKFCPNNFGWIKYEWRCY